MYAMIFTVTNVVSNEKISSMTKLRVIEFIKTAGWLGGGSVMLAIILLGITIWEHIRSQNVATIVYGVLVMIFFSFGCYIAWSKERDKFELEAVKHELPDFKLTLGPVLTSYNPNMDITTICMSVVLLNRGAPSIASGWKARYQSPQIDITIGYFLLPSEEFDWPLSNGQYLVLKRRELIAAKTLTAIEKGHCAYGRILFEFQGDRRAELANGIGRIWLGCYDYTERLTQEIFQGYSTPDLNFFADEEVRNPPMLPLDFTTPGAPLLDQPQ
jgi:hypothetical protein